MIINNRIAFLLADQQRGDYPPTDQAIEFSKEVFQELDTELNKLSSILNEKLPVINQQLSEMGGKIL